MFLGVNKDIVVSLRELGDALKVSEAHLSKLLQRLNRSGFLNSARGPKGGYKLAIPLDKITLLDIYEAIDGPFELRDCLFEKKRCKDGKCLFGKLLRKMDIELRDYLRDTSLSRLSKDVYLLFRRRDEKKKRKKG